MQNLQLRLGEIAHLWNDVEGRIKEAELIRAEVVGPSINELRYAGRRLVDVVQIVTSPEVTPEQQEDVQHILFEIEQLCIRAKHDVVDALVLFIHQRLELMIAEFGVPIVYAYFPDFVRLRSEMHEVDTRATRQTARDLRGYQRKLHPTSNWFIQNNERVGGSNPRCSRES